MRTTARTKILKEQMGTFFRGEDTCVPARYISKADMGKIRILDVELIKTYLPEMDNETRQRAIRTITMIVTKYY